MTKANSSSVIAGNYFDKYNSRNLIVQALMKGFLNSFHQLIQGRSFTHVLDTGCGEGHLTRQFLHHHTDKNFHLTALDISPEILYSAKENCPSTSFIAASTYRLPFKDEQFDLVLANEILEHVDNPVAALQEINRVSKGYILFSVPREPIWRFLNICRFQYINHLGNTPGHIQHWSKKGFIRMLSEVFNIVDEKSPIPWTLVLCLKRTK